MKPSPSIMDLAKKEANKSSMAFRHGCVAYYHDGPLRGEVFAAGHNYLTARVNHVQLKGGF
jgi:hypothetical protein